LYHVKVEKLDGERVNAIDYDLAKSFKGEEVTHNEWDNGNFFNLLIISSLIHRRRTRRRKSSTNIRTSKTFNCSRPC